MEDKGVRPCGCKNTGRTDLLLSQARIPRRYLDCSFDDFIPLSASVQSALMNSRMFVDEYPLVEVGLLYLGRSGVGKTHLATSVLKALIKKGIPALFYDFRDLLKEIQDSYNPNTHTSEVGILAPVFNAEVLVLDELGASKPTEWVQETMTHVISKRYNDKKVTIFTSNYLDLSRESDPDALAVSAREESLTDRVGVRLRSRLHEMCRVILIEGDDYRERIKKGYYKRFFSSQ